MVEKRNRSKTKPRTHNKPTNLKFVLVVYSNGIPVKGGKHTSSNPEYIGKKAKEYRK